LLNASVGVQRALARLRPATSHRSSKALTIRRHSLAVARAIRGLVVRPHIDVLNLGRGALGRAAVVSPSSGIAPNRHDTPLVTRAVRPGTSHLSPRSACATTAPIVAPRTVTHRSLIARIGAERAVPAAAVAILLVATAISSAPAAGPSGPVGGPTGDGAAARLAAGASTARSGPHGAVDELGADSLGLIDDRELAAAGEGALGAPEYTSTSGAFLDDGTILKPVAVDTTVDDGKGLMRSYKVRSGDTLTGIARKFGVSMMTVWWANHLKSKDDLHVGQTLTIPPVSGVVITVGPTDTLASLAARYQVEESEIVQTNELDDPNLVIGQTLTIPGGHGAGITAPAPAKAKPHSSGSSGTSRPPTRYTGGSFAWPVAGGYISQYYHYGHYAIDIAADTGTAVKAAAAGTVIFAGWKNNGGGYQVWISHGSNLYTTYNHMSRVLVGQGQHVSRSQQVGRVGMTGNATGPHLHFEVWRGPIWNGGVRVNPLIYL
jgi:murein DD-endopeptidase MepM/ murein hydrolase activator NlpD